MVSESLAPNCEKDVVAGTTTTDFVDDWEVPKESVPINNFTRELELWAPNTN